MQDYTFASVGDDKMLMMYVQSFLRNDIRPDGGNADGIRVHHQNP